MPLKVFGAQRRGNGRDKGLAFLGYLFARAARGVLVIQVESHMRDTVIGNQLRCKKRRTT